MNAKQSSYRNHGMIECFKCKVESIVPELRANEYEFVQVKHLFIFFFIYMNVSIPMLLLMTESQIEPIFHVAARFVNREI